MPISIEVFPCYLNKDGSVSKTARYWTTKVDGEVVQAGLGTKREVYEVGRRHISRMAALNAT